MTPRPIQPGDTVRVLDTPYTRDQEPVRQAIGQTGQVINVTPTDPEVLGFDAIYQVSVGLFEFALIEADLELVARPARIR